MVRAGREERSLHSLRPHVYDFLCPRGCVEGIALAALSNRGLCAQYAYTGDPLL